MFIFDEMGIKLHNMFEVPSLILKYDIIDGRKRQ